MQVAWPKGKLVKEKIDIGGRMAFRNVKVCLSEGKEKHAIVADLDGTLTRGRSSFPYFMLMAIEGGSILRGAVLILVASIVWLLYHFVSEEAGIKVLIFVSTFAGLKVKHIEGVVRAVLPKVFADDNSPRVVEGVLVLLLQPLRSDDQPKDHQPKDHGGVLLQESSGS
ncbi:hypothetical protein L7F22_009032 [Adiantum nelumboides]|nr:hypothetical protein [Adiantum nelumboides]